MVATCTLLKLTPLQWKPYFLYMQHLHHDPSFSFYSKPQLRSNFLPLQMAVKYKQSTFSDTYVRSNTNRLQIWNNSSEKIVIHIKKTLESLKKPATAAVLLGLLFLCGHNYCASAASDGRIGGSAVSSNSGSSKSSSSSSSSSSYCYSYSSSYSNDEYNTFVLILMIGVTLMIPIGRIFCDIYVSHRSSTTSIFKLQVGLMGSAKTLQQNFNSLAETADTSTRTGLSYVLNEATFALMRHPEYCISCYSSLELEYGLEEGMTRFNQLSIQERVKFDEETLVNVNSIKRQSSKIEEASGVTNEYIVAAQYPRELQTIKGIADLKDALEKLGSIPSSNIMAVEILWTPQDEKDVLSEKELLEDYPLLKPLISTS